MIATRVAADDPRARAWVAHLRAGGTIPWRQWALGVEPTRAEPESGDGGGPLPGAAQLEVVRRLAARREAAGDRDAPASEASGGWFAALADNVLGRSGPGRGAGEIPLAEPAYDGSPVSGTPAGTPAADPAAVPDSELLRVCVGAIAELLVTGAVGTRPGGASSGASSSGVASAGRHPGTTRASGLRRLPLRGRVTVVGAPDARGETSVRALRRAGFLTPPDAEAPARPRVVVAVAPLEHLLAQAWSARVQHGAAVRWSSFVERVVRADRPPPGIDLPAVVGRWADQVGARRVALAPAGSELRRTLEHGRTLEHRHIVLDPVAVDLLRRLNAVLNVRVPADRHRLLRAQVAALLAPRSAPPGVPAASPAKQLGVPTAHTAWARDHAARMSEALAAGGYPVLGASDLPALLSGAGAPTRRSIRAAEVLDLALDLCLQLADGRPAGHHPQTPEVLGS
ncbi:MAG TPA: hypothetical protein VFG88_05535 [Nocardioidaceae bacterium]|nr:hypothetical protein [Nocardioidaceae bacterium]